MSEKVAKYLIAIGLLFVVGCDSDPNATKIQYMPDMADAPTVKTQESYIDPPDFSVAMNAILYPDTAEDAEKQLQNPFAGAPEVEAVKHLKDGKFLFDTFCAVCHGLKAKGAGYVVDKFPRPPDLTSEAYANRGDGFYFHKITFGSAIMPSHGHAISPHERWNIILYLRTLQKVGK